jgi:hypothetical protein
MGAMLRVTAASAFTAFVTLIGCATVLDISADPVVLADGGSASPGSGLRVFVTSAKSAGNLRNGTPLSGVNGADETCRQLARAANLGGTWVAWIAAGDAVPSSRNPANGPWRLVDGKTIVFADRQALASPPKEAIDLDEHGNKVLHDEPVWTGSSKSCGNCAVWTSETGAADLSSPTTGGIGLVGSTTAAWTEASSCAPCRTLAHLYCFER